MPLKMFGPNRMAAQQEPEDSGTSLVRNRPSWGMGPKNMPGSFDYDPKPTEGGGQRGVKPREPNRYEQGGFFWTGNSVAQGTPIAQQNQRLDMTEQDNARRWAAQAIDDKAQNLQVRNVDARIRQADAGQELQERKFGMDADFRDRGLRLDERRLDADTGFKERGLKLDEYRIPENARLKELEIDARNARADTKLQVQERDRRREGVASSNPERWYSIYEGLNRENPDKSLRSAYRNTKGMMGGDKLIPTEHSQRFINRVDALAADPRLNAAPEQYLAQLAMMNGTFDDQGRLIAQGPDGKWMLVNLPTQ